MEIKGIAASPGIVRGRALVLRLELALDERLLPADEVAAEVARLHEGIGRARADLTGLIAAAEGPARAILQAHELMLQDPELLAAAEREIATARVTAGVAIHRAGEGMAAMLAALEDPYLRERAADVRDVARQVGLALTAARNPALSLTEPAVIVAGDLSPSDTVRLDRSRVLALVTEKGGPTSHTAIIARSLGIPAVVGAAGVLAAAATGLPLVVDGSAGSVLINPTPDEAARADRQIARAGAEAAALTALRDLPAVTLDGRRMKLAANVGHPGDAASAVAAGAEGVGLYRTEFLFMNRSDLPDEEEQYAAYKAVALAMPGHPVVIRTLDIGGDKKLPALPLPKEENPFLGVRALRLCLVRPDLFRTQLRAILRASAHGPVRIMYPMVAGLLELRAANAMLAEAKAALRRDGLLFDEQIPAGIMIETPSAALTVDLLASEADFFSIGTNDLIQYTVAADRMNDGVAHLYQPFHPAVLRLIKTACTMARARGRHVGMCGEMAGNPVAAPVLIGLGLDELSMAPSALAAVKRVIRSVDYDACHELAAKLLNGEDGEQNRMTVEAFLRESVKDNVKETFGAD